jgi:hypothetical protein
MQETLLILVTAHLLADFVFQPDWMVRRKGEWPVLLGHAGIVAASAIVLLGALPVVLLLLLAGTHLVQDLLKARWFPRRCSPLVFGGDQLLHGVVLLGLAVLFPRAAAEGVWLRNYGLDAMPVIVLLGGAALCVPAGGVLIGLLMRNLLTPEEAEEIRGLEHGGRYIGWLERALVLLLILINQPGGIGFLVAAKSILRFGEVKSNKDRRIIEYIIIGTFLSFAWGLAASAGMMAVMRQYRG